MTGIKVRIGTEKVEGRKSGVNFRDAKSMDARCVVYFDQFEYPHEKSADKPGNVNKL